MHFIFFYSKTIHHFEKLVDTWKYFGVPYEMVFKPFECTCMLVFLVISIYNILPIKLILTDLSFVVLEKHFFLHIVTFILACDLVFVNHRTQVTWIPAGLIVMSSLSNGPHSGSAQQSPLGGSNTFKIYKRHIYACNLKLSITLLWTH